MIDWHKEVNSNDLTGWNEWRVNAIVSISLVKDLFTWDALKEKSSPEIRMEGLNINEFDQQLPWKHTCTMNRWQFSWNVHRTWILKSATFEQKSTIPRGLPYHLKCDSPSHWKNKRFCCRIITGFKFKQKCVSVTKDDVQTEEFQAHFKILNDSAKFPKKFILLFNCVYCETTNWRFWLSFVCCIQLVNVGSCNFHSTSLI